jgi:hypothetical protein
MAERCFHSSFCHHPACFLVQQVGDFQIAPSGSRELNEDDIIALHLSH